MRLPKIFQKKSSKKNGNRWRYLKAHTLFRMTYSTKWPRQKTRWYSILIKARNTMTNFANSKNVVQSSPQNVANQQLRFLTSTTKSLIKTRRSSFHSTLWEMMTLQASWVASIVPLQSLLTYRVEWQQRARWSISTSLKLLRICSVLNMISKSYRRSYQRDSKKWTKLLLSKASDFKFRGVLMAKIFLKTIKWSNMSCLAKRSSRAYKTGCSNSKSHLVDRSRIRTPKSLCLLKWTLRRRETNSTSTKLIDSINLELDHGWPRPNRVW
jgi:hypothetical protein